MSKRKHSIVLMSALSVTAALVSLTSLPARAAGPRPLFQLPFPCGEVWTLATYPGHGDYNIDMTATTGGTDGRPIVASYEGTVVFAGWHSGGGGWTVRIDHGGDWRTGYAHMKEAPSVAFNQPVSRGQLLGFVGSTGNATGSHLHYSQAIALYPGDTGDTPVEAYFNGVSSGITDDAKANSTTRTSYNCSAVGAVRDFSGDGKADILARHASTRDLHLYRGNGAGGFQSGTGGVIGNNWSAFDILLSAGDFDRDGDQDVIARHASTKDLHLFRGNGAGGFQSGTGGVIGNNWSAFNRIFGVGDFDGDGKADLAARHAATADLYLFRGNGTGGFLSSAVIGNNWSAFDMLLSPGDFDSDGDSDIIARHASTKDLHLFRGNGAGGFQSGTGGVIGNNWSAFNRIFAVGDFNGDGKADVLARHAATTDLHLFLGNGTGGFQSSAVIGNNWSNFDQLF